MNKQGYLESYKKYEVKSFDHVKVKQGPINRALFSSDNPCSVHYKLKFFQQNFRFSQISRTSMARLLRLFRTRS